VTIRLVKQFLWRTFFVVLFLDPLLVGWLVFSADTVGEFAKGAALSVAIPGFLYGSIYLLESFEDRREGNTGRHARRSRTCGFWSESWRRRSGDIQ
jgi:hypothetical protein